MFFDNWITNFNLCEPGSIISILLTRETQRASHYYFTDSPDVNYIKCKYNYLR